MYHKLYGLKQSPFNVSADPQFFFESSSHKEALAALLYGIYERKGIILVTGEVGTGKTTLCRTLLEKIPSEIKTSFILNPYFSDVQLLQAIVEDFGLKAPKNNRLEIIRTLNTFLVDINSYGSNAVLIVDEAQDLTARQLEQVRLLSNLETSQGKLLQIILSGQPELLNKLNSFGLRQISQRIFVRHNLIPLKKEEIGDYVEFRLKKAGAVRANILEDNYEIIYDFSKGIPRLINMLCDRALLLGFVKNCKAFNQSIFESCIRELK
ncbi:MAG: AAA family ATPase [Candidatus Omnitrophota bacterium]